MGALPFNGPLGPDRAHWAQALRDSDQGRADRRVPAPAVAASHFEQVAE